MAFTTQRTAAYWALINLQQFLPATPQDGKEWGMMVFRGEDPEGGYYYDFQWPPYKGQTENYWQPTVPVPDGTKQVAYCHSHPNNKWFSKTDVLVAKGEIGGLFVRQKTVFYMVNHSGGYWYDGVTKYLLDDQRSGILWGLHPSKY